MLPTAFTPPAHSFAFRDFELVFLSMGYSPTATTSLTGGTFFPISGSFGVLSLGVKQQVYNADGTAIALTGGTVLPLESDFETVFHGGAVVSHRFAAGGHDDAFGLHAAAGYVWNEDGGEGLLGFGAEARLGGRAKFIAEFISAQENSLDGAINLGISLHGERLSADIVGVRPLETDGDFLFFPLVIVNYRF